MNDLSISAIIPVYNCEKTIGTVLECLVAAIPPTLTLEIIMVDDASTDGTAAVCRQFPVQLIQVPENQGPAYCRNLGVRNSKGNVLLFLDSDIEFDTGLLNGMIEHLRNHPELSGIFTLTSPEPLNKTFTSRYFALQEYLRFMDVIENGCHTWSFISTRCGLIRRSVFEETGGFNESFATAAYEDLEFSSRMDDRHQLALRADLTVRHYWPDTLLKMCRRLHTNARGVFSFSPEMRKKASTPFIKDRNARAFLGISWLLLGAGFLWRPFWVGAAAAHVAALQQASWLIRGCFAHESGFFALRAWLAYNLTVVPFATGVALGLLDKTGILAPPSKKSSKTT